MLSHNSMIIKYISVLRVLHWETWSKPLSFALASHKNVQVVYLQLLLWLWVWVRKICTSQRELGRASHELVSSVVHTGALVQQKKIFPISLHEKCIANLWNYSYLITKFHTHVRETLYPHAFCTVPIFLHLLINFCVVLYVSCQKEQQ